MVLLLAVLLVWISCLGFFSELVSTLLVTLCVIRSIQVVGLLSYIRYDSEDLSSLFRDTCWCFSFLTLIFLLFWSKRVWMQSCHEITKTSWLYRLINFFCTVKDVADFLEAVDVVSILCLISTFSILLAIPLAYSRSTLDQGFSF